MPAPTGLTLQIDGGSPITSDLTVDLGIVVTGATEMRFSNDGVSFSPWEPIASTKLAWSLLGYGSINDTVGVKTVWVDARDAVGDESNASNSIEYRRAKPSVKLYPAPLQRAGTTIVDIPVILYDPYFNPVDVIVAEWTLDGTFTDGNNISFLPNDGAHDGVAQLSTAPGGVQHNLVWDAALDIEEPDVSDIAAVRVKVVYANEESELALSQQFLVDTRAPIEVADLRFTRGDSAGIRLVLLDRNGEPFDATGPVEITSIKNPSGVEQLTSPIVATSGSTGHYVATYLIDTAAELGLWVSKWEYTADNVASEESVYFSIIEEVTPYTPTGTDTCVVYGQLLHGDQKPMSNREVHFIPHHLSDPELGNPTVISTNPIITSTDDEGRFNVELIKNMELIIYIPSLSFRSFAKVPALDTSEFRAMMTLLPVPPRDQFGNRL